MYVIATILARAGSKGLPDKCMRPLLGQPVIDYTFDHALANTLIDDAVLTTDSAPAADSARARGIKVITRPAELASDTATVDSAVRHAVETVEADGHGPVNIVVLLYGNIPVRASGIIDRVVKHLIDTGADSVRTVAPVTKQHPDWVHRLDGDRMQQYRTNSIYRRQDLDPLYDHDGAVAAVTRQALFSPAALAGDAQAFLGRDRRAIVQAPQDAVDVDGPLDLCLAEALLMANPDGRSDGSPALSKGGGLKHMATSCRERPPSRRIHIGQAAVGFDCPVFIVAEAGVNHDGDLHRALDLVDAAAQAGADAIKFHAFTADALTTSEVSTATYQAARTNESSQRAMLSRLELSTEDLERIAARCAERGIVFLATPFSVPDVDRLVRIGTPAIKIASTDLVDGLLLERACRTGLPLIVSTGAADEDEIAEAVDCIRRWSAGDRLVLMHCVSCYPTPLADANLNAIGTLQNRFATIVGYSDHTTSTQTGALAVGAGACVLEKHFTLDCAAAGPDHAMSLEPDALADYIRQARQAQQAMGSGRLAVQPIECEVRTVGRKCIVAARDIAAGETLGAGSLTAKRAGGGLQPKEINAVLGKRASVAIPADTPLAWEMVR